MLHIDLNKKGLTLNGIFMEKIDEKRFSEILGEPRTNTFRGEYKGTVFYRNVCIWDDLGFLINIPTDEDREYSLEFKLVEDLERIKNAKFDYYNLNPKGFFTGKFTVEGKAILEAFSEKELKDAYFHLKKKIKNWEISFNLLDEVVEQVADLSWQDKTADNVLKILRNNEQPFQSFWFAYAPPKPKKVSSGKYNLPKPTETDVIFKNLNFKLAVVQELMYVQEALKPKFDIYEFCQDYTKREINPDDYYTEMIPEVKKWFKDLPIPKELADKVTELYFDGGNEIYAQLIPQWDGEDDIFYIKSLTEAELAQFPNLKKIDGTAIFITDKIGKFLKNRGIEIINQ